MSTVAVAGCSLNESNQTLNVEVANQSSQEITATLVLSRDDLLQFETEVTVAAGESWSTDHLENQRYFAVVSLVGRDELAYQGYYAECDEGELTAMIRDSSVEFLQTRCG